MMLDQVKYVYVLFLCVLIGNTAYAQKKTVAITLDDLLVAGASKYTLEEIEAINNRLLGHLDKLNIPVTGFVNEKSLYVMGEMDRRTAVLNAWAERGQLSLGNHTYSHPSFHDTRLENFKTEVLKGETVTRMVLDKVGKPLRYFRFPFNSAGSDSTSKAAFEQFLSAHEYAIAPMTIEGSDYIYNTLYKAAKQDGDQQSMAAVRTAYLQHTSNLFAFFEEMALAKHGRPIAHIFLGHINELHADVMPKLVAMLQDKGYTIVSLDEAMKDSVYAQKDPYIGKWGFSWMHRWNKENRMEWLRKEPEPSEKTMADYKRLNQ